MRYSISKTELDELKKRKEQYDHEISATLKSIEKLYEPGVSVDVTRYNHYMLYLADRRVYLSHCMQVIADKEKICEQYLAEYQHAKISYDRFSDKNDELKHNHAMKIQKIEDNVLENLYITTEGSRRGYEN